MHEGYIISAHRPLFEALPYDRGSCSAALAVRFKMLGSANWRGELAKIRKEDGEAKDTARENANQDSKIISVSASRDKRTKNRGKSLLQESMQPNAI